MLGEVYATDRPVPRTLWFRRKHRALVRRYVGTLGLRLQKSRGLVHLLASSGGTADRPREDWIGE